MIQTVEHRASSQGELKDLLLFTLHGVQTDLGPVTSFFPIYPSWKENSHPMPTPPSNFWKQVMFDFTSSQLESNLPQDESYLESHPYLI